MKVDSIISATSSSGSFRWCLEEVWKCTEVLERVFDSQRGSDDEVEDKPRSTFLVGFALTSLSTSPIFRKLVLGRKTPNRAVQLSLPHRTPITVKIYCLFSSLVSLSLLVSDCRSASCSCEAQGSSIMSLYLDQKACAPCTIFPDF